MRNRKVEVTVGALVVAAALTIVRVGSPSGAVHAQEAAMEDGRGTCSIETLKGRYGLAFHGLGTSAPVPAPIGEFIPVAGVGMIIFNGDGTLSLSETVSFGGKVAPLITHGTYTVAPDCTGSLTAVNSAHLNFIIVHNGREILAINTDPGRVAIDNLEKL